MIIINYVQCIYLVQISCINPLVIQYDVTIIYSYNIVMVVDAMASCIPRVVGTLLSQ